MAIIVEEEGGGVGIVRFLMWLFIIAIIAVAGYYIFFAKPEYVEIVVPQSLQAKSIDPLAGISLDSSGVINGESFQSLKKYVTPPQPGSAGRSNPFVPK